MNCEIEFLPVGDGSKAGDAIIIRYGEPNAYRLMIVDGGTLDSGKDIVKHVREQFGSQAVISHVVLTHSDGDHASGLREVLKELPVLNFWLHVPWMFASQSRPYFSKNWTDEGLAKEIRGQYEIIEELVALAIERKVPIYQPFSGEVIGPFRVVAPYEHVYPIFLAQFDKTPSPDQAAIEATGLWIGKQPGLLGRIIEKVTAKAQTWITESWDNERLKDGGVTSATNETSVVLYAETTSGRVLLTGDAGYWDLLMTIDYCQKNGLPLQIFKFVQIPHHGSRRNVGPTILNQLLGPIRPQTALRQSLAFVSAPKDDASHPRKIVLNAFMRRGFEYSATQGNKIVFWGGFPPRPGYNGIPPCEFNTKVENYD